MPAFLPFRGIRYDVARLGCGHDAVSAPPYDVIDDDELVRREAAHARNVVRLTLPRDEQADDRYTAAARRLAAWRRDGTLVADPEPRFYRYRMTFDDEGRRRTTTGVIGAMELTPLGPGGVLPHERTLPKAKSDRLSLMRATHANLEPIWGLSLAAGLTESIAAPTRILATCTDGGVDHELSAIDDPAVIAAVSDAVARHPVVLADGHHRYETALAYRAERQAQGGPADGPADLIMTLIVELSAEQLCVRPIHRLVRGGDAVLDRVDEWFDSEPVAALADLDPGTSPMPPPGSLGLARNGQLWWLHPRPAAVEPLLAEIPPALHTVASAISDVTVERALADAGAEINYRHDGAAIVALVASGTWDAGILLSAPSIDAIHAVADAGIRMPQKTTFFHPKPASGLVIRALDD